MSLLMSPDERRRRMERAADRLGGNTRLGHRLGYKDGSYVGQMLRGERAISEKTLAALAEIKEVSDLFVWHAGPDSSAPAGFALAGNDELPEAHPVSHQIDTVASLSLEDTMGRLPPADGYVRLPILAEAAAGAGRDPDAYELIEHVDVAESWVRSTLRTNPSTLRVMTARGQSMRGVIEDGDAMFVSPVTDFTDDGVYVISVGGLLRVKRLRLLVRDKALSIESTDGSPAETIPLGNVDDSLRICGRVLGAWSLRRM